MYILIPELKPNDEHSVIPLFSPLCNLRTEDAVICRCLKTGFQNIQTL